MKDLEGITVVALEQAVGLGHLITHGRFIRIDCVFVFLQGNQSLAPNLDEPLSADFQTDDQWAFRTKFFHESWKRNTGNQRNITSLSLAVRKIDTGRRLGRTTDTKQDHISIP